MGKSAVEGGGQSSPHSYGQKAISTTPRVYSVDIDM